MKFVTIKTNDNKNSYRVSWAEQIILDKLAKYGRRTIVEGKYEVVAETEKAVKIRVDNIYTNAGDDCDDWDIWMPKSAVEEA